MIAVFVYNYVDGISIMSDIFYLDSCHIISLCMNVYDT